MDKKNEKTKGFFAEFKKFALRGNVIEMAVGIVLGASFNAIVTSIVQGILNPLIGTLLGNVDLSDLKIILTPAAGEIAEVAIRYGLVIQKTIEFVITAFVMFLIVKGMNKINDLQQKLEQQKKAEEKAAAVKTESENTALLKEIVSLLKEQKKTEK